MTAAASRPLTKRVLWIAFAVVFYHAGEAFTRWLIEPQAFGGTLDWLWVMAFPIVLPGFFVVNRALGCAAGTCAGGTCDITPGAPDGDKQQHTPRKVPRI